MAGLIAYPSSRGLTGRPAVPGDKSVSHRALILGLLTVGRTEIEGLLEGEDVLRTAEAARALGAVVARTGPGRWSVDGVGVGGLAEPDDVLDLGNSGTAARLLLGPLASHPLTAFLTGDHSLRRRPMARVTAPLSGFGARFVGREGMRLPLAVIGAREPMPVEYRLPVASAQVKSAVLLAGLAAPGITRVIEPWPTRDHTERMLGAFGARVTTEEEGDARVISVEGEVELSPCPVRVPRDVSSAAFPLVAALLVPGSEVVLPDVGMNPGRTGLIRTLEEMGADLVVENERLEAGEPVADLRARGTRRLKGVRVAAERAPSMIDEYPILAVAAAFADGETRMEGLGELRVKESDRLAAMARGLAAAGVDVDEEPETLTVRGGARVPGNARVVTDLDHRIAMAFLVLGLAAGGPIAVDDAGPIATSFPDFVPLMRDMGARLENAPE